MRFRFNFAERDLPDTLFAIFSRRTRQAVYRRPYHADLSLPVDAELSDEGFYDSL